MKKISRVLLAVYCWLSAAACFAADKFDVLPDLPEPLSAAQASSVTTSDSANTLGIQTVGQEPNLISLVFSLIFVVLLIYATGIIYAKLNKLGLNTMKKQIGERDGVSVLSTTNLGNNRTLHVVELDGERMLIGASQNSIHLIKDLGTCPTEVNEGEYSKIEIPNIRIPKIEIPKIEIPGFTRVLSKITKEQTDKTEQTVGEQTVNDSFEISDIYEEENPDGIIDKLFETEMQNKEAAEENIEHKVDPDDFALYKKYLS